MVKIIKHLVLLALVHSPVFADDHVKLVGHYTNMVVSADEDPHFLSGYNVDLYTRNSVALARLAVAVGSQEPVWATVQEVVFNPRTRKLRFRAEYSDGWEFSKQIGPAGRAARTIFTFSGNVKPRSIVGIVTTRDGYCDDCKPKSEKVILKRTSDTSVYLPD